MQLKLPGAAAALVLALAGCAQKPPPPPAGPPEDLTGAAKSCTVSDVSLTPGRETAAKMEVVNDGGWCAFRLRQPAGGAYAAELLTAPPANGRVFYHKVNDFTRVEYTPKPGFRGTDSFTVRLLPGEATLRVAVTVR